ncbi:uncharacterized protein LOC125950912 [Anopheles darlingi]|uniref:uncharacterized protein LOC125950912 n=1 Tax=Anopheles darlingi TaxID=43151 RepID=UPI00210002C2|nr:uncharacterized protein LOC125950912 [Anopheles darlingi]XP_049535254.1 uncharacterized protein LOC125950912 [Anopheles darlingi]XP_049535255.1 uncharacterized protein LOC125950912 [Anopheles darlingi]
MSSKVISSSFIRRLLEVNNKKLLQRHFVSTRDPYSDPRGFTLSDMKKNPAVLPLVIIMATAVVGCSGFIVYCGRTRTDVSLNKKVFEHDTMDVMDPKQRKILVFNQKYGAMPELNEALSYREDYEKLQSGAEK